LSHGQERLSHGQEKQKVRALVAHQLSGGGEMDTGQSNLADDDEE
jgi:hypothetical protein